MTKRRFLVYARYLSECSVEASLYGKCISQKAEQIKKDDCREEFKNFKTCVEKL